jgi:hypothetical protein
VDGLIFWAVVSARVLVPLAIPRFPLPAMLAALVIDGVDQTIFQTFTSLDLSGYQSYDKALDVYYLSIAYTATLRNWTHLPAFDVSRFLFYYRLIGVVLFELTQVRALLLVFPNTFEYFFDFYEAVRVRWNPLRMSTRLVIGAAAFIWIFIKLPQEWWIHVAQLDATDTIKTKIFGVPTDTSWPDAIAANPSVVVITVLVLVVLAVAAWWVVTRRLPPADHPPTFDADAHQPRVDPGRVAGERRRLAEQLFDRELFEKIALVSLVSVIFSRMLPGIDAAPWSIAAGVGVVIVVDTFLSERAARTGRPETTTVRHFASLLVANIAILVAGQFVIGFLTGRVLEHAFVFVLLLTLIVTLYDRYRPIHLVRFADPAPGGAAGPASVPVAE